MNESINFKKEIIKFEDLTSVNENESITEKISHSDKDPNDKDIRQHMTDMELIMLIFKNSFFIFLSKLIFGIMENITIIFLSNFTDIMRIFIITCSIRNILFIGIGYGIAFTAYYINLKFSYKNNFYEIGQSTNRAIILIFLLSSIMILIPLFFGDLFKLIYDDDKISSIRLFILHNHPAVFFSLINCIYSFFLYSQNLFYVSTIIDLVSCIIQFCGFKIFFPKKYIIEEIDKNANTNRNITDFTYQKFNFSNNILFGLFQMDNFELNIDQENRNNKQINIIHIAKNSTENSNIFQILLNNSSEILNNFSNSTFENSKTDISEESIFITSAWILNAVFFLQFLFYFIFIYVYKPFPSSNVRLSKNSFVGLFQYFKFSLNFIIIYFFLTLMCGQFNVFYLNIFKDANTWEILGYNFSDMSISILRNISLGFFMVIFKLAKQIRRRKFNGFLSRLTKLFLIFTLPIICILLAIFQIFVGNIAGLYTDDADVRSNAIDFLRFFSLIIIPFHLTISLQGILLANKYIKTVTYVYLVCAILINLPLTYLLCGALNLGNKGIFITGFFTQTIIGFILFYYVTKLKSYEEIDEEKYSIIT